MADLRIVDAPVLLQKSITDDGKKHTGGLGNYAIRLGDLVWYVVQKEQLASKNYVDSKDGDLTTLKTFNKTTLVKAVNEGYDSSKGVVDLYAKNIAAGAGANGWTTELVVENGVTQKQINAEQK